MFSKLVKIASVESFTGGAFSHRIVSQPGASQFFKGALVAYHNDIKTKLGVDVSKGVVNEDVARQMALLGKDYFDVDYCISFTGNAGPTSVDGEVGLVFIAINEQVFKLKLESMERQDIINYCVEYAINKLNEIIK